VSDPAIRFVVALEAEARPIAERFRLEPVGESHAFRIFRGEAAWLVVAGFGKAAAAAATAYLHLAAGGELGRPWLHVGIGGHSRRTLGELLLAHKVDDRASGLAWYPPLVIDAPCPTAPFLTVERREEEYEVPWVYETEAAGFYPTACRFSTAELVHAFAVISDNPEANVSGPPSAPFVEELVARHLDAIESFGRGLGELALEAAALAADPPGYREIVARSLFGLTEQRRLRRLLQRLAVLAPGEPLPPAAGGSAAPARDVLRHLEVRLSRLPLELAPPTEAAIDVVH